MSHSKENIFLTATLFLFLILYLTACGKAPEKNAVVATIGTSEITLSDFNERIANLPPRYGEIVKKRKKEFLDEIVNDTLLYQEAVRVGLNNDKDVQKVIEQARRKIMIARLLKDKVDDRIIINEEDIVTFYNDNSDKYMTPEIMRVSHILVQNQEDADSVLEELVNGKSFESLAKAKSVDPTAQRGGDIGYFPKGQLMPRFEEACSQLEIGEISGVVKTKLGYHIIKLTDRRAPELRPLEKVREDIESRLRMVNRQKLFNDLLQHLRKTTKIEIDEEIMAGDYTTALKNDEEREE
ncbi:peptidylprolyl isomerase [Candidatus Omnitrophota bacterium]